MSNKAKKVKAAVKQVTKARTLTLKQDTILDALIDHLDLLVGQFACPCCIRNYYALQRGEVEKQIASRIEMIEAGGCLKWHTTFDVVGDDYAADDSDVPLIGDSVFFRLTLDDTEITQWDGHLKPHLRGDPKTE